MLEIQTADSRTVYRPHEEVIGTARWSFDRPIRSIALELLWTTRGKGTVDTVIVDSACFENPSPHDHRDFRLRLPDSPYSFSGKLVSVVWAIRLVADPGNEVMQMNLVVSPTGREIDLTALQ